MKKIALAAALLAMLGSQPASATPVSADDKPLANFTVAVSDCGGKNCGLAASTGRFGIEQLIAADYEYLAPIGVLIIADDGSFQAQQVRRYHKYCSLKGLAVPGYAGSCYQSAPQATSVPEPGTLLLLGAGLLLAFRRQNSIR